MIIPNKKTERYPIVYSNDTSDCQRINCKNPAPTTLTNSGSNMTKRRKPSLMKITSNHTNDDSTPLNSPTNSNLVDIESCIDNPLTAPLGNHVKVPATKIECEFKCKSPCVRSNSQLISVDHSEKDIELTVTSPCKELEPIASLTLRRRRLTATQLENHLSILFVSPINVLGKVNSSTQSFQLVELDLSRNRLADLPRTIATFCPNLRLLNLSNNCLTFFPAVLLQLVHLEVLDLSQNKIAGPMPHRLPICLPNLKILKLCSNRITELPPTLDQLKNLKSLMMASIFGGNLLTSFPSGCISKMPNLVELVLSHNQLKHLPEDIGHPGSKLEYFSAMDNKLGSIPKSIGLCTKLRSLNLSRNQIASLPVEIADLSKLETLDLSHNLLCIIPGDIADFLKRTTLLLNGNPFTRGDCGYSPRNHIQHTILGNCQEPGSTNINIVDPTKAYSTVVAELAKQAISPMTVESNEFDNDARLDFSLYYAKSWFSSHSSSPTSLSTRSSTPIPSSLAERDSFAFTTIGTSLPSSLLLPSQLYSPPSLPSSSSYAPRSLELPTPSSNPNLIPSLVEYAARAILLNEVSVSPGSLPQRLNEYLIQGGRPCSYCHQPYVKQWVSSIQVKGYLGHPDLLRRIRFCSTKCWNSYLKRINERDKECNYKCDNTCVQDGCKINRTCWRVKCVVDDHEDEDDINHVKIGVVNP